MQIIVAGAGAGKTSSMAQMVLDRYNETESKIIYVVTYTNAAKNHIENKIKKINGHLPKRILVETIHAFLLREFIFPYHHLLYGKQFTRVSQIKLPHDYRHKAMKIKELGSQKFIHVEKVTEVAKWIVYGKSNDKKDVKKKREKVLSIITRFLDSVFVDEAQDMDNHFLKIVEVLEEKGINLCLVGDPKQDLRGRFAFNDLIDTYPDSVIYKPENHRCPVSHVLFSNSYIFDKEKQKPMTETLGLLNYCYEDQVDIEEILRSKKWDYTYIYNKNERFFTNKADKNSGEENLEYELKSLIAKTNLMENEIDKITYLLKKKVLNKLYRAEYYIIFSWLERILSIILSNTDKARLAFSFDLILEKSDQKGILVNSIDSIKGLEGDNCIFILTTSLAPYFFKEKADKKKMLNYLYVALTRSKKELLIFVTKEVKKKYGEEFLESKFQSFGINKLKHNSSKNNITIA